MHHYKIILGVLLIVLVGFAISSVQARHGNIPLPHPAKATGGNISFRHDKGEDTFQPVKGDLFLVSNERGFWHKAGDTKIQRRVASFNFKTNAI